ncbi:alpha/beta fold hydrolase [Nannocystaceae bacterium ST9]
MNVAIANDNSAPSSARGGAWPAIHGWASDGVDEIAFVHEPYLARPDLARPDARPRGAVLVMPAMGVEARYYEPLAVALAARGFAVARAELRGHGASPVRAGRGRDFGYRELAERSLPALIEALRERWPNVPRIVLGHSLGGQVASLYASLPGADLDALILIASGSVDHRGWPASQQTRVLFGTQLYAMIARVLGYFPGDKLGFAGREPRSQILDWAHNARTGRWQLRGSARDWEAALGEVDLPVLAISVDGDDYAPHGAVDRQVAKLRAAQVERIRLTRESAPPELLHHFRWARSPESMVATIDEWLTRALDRR